MYVINAFRMDSIIKNNKQSNYILVKFLKSTGYVRVYALKAQLNVCVVDKNTIEPFQETIKIYFII